jgi:hypothetical protein
MPDLVPIEERSPGLQWYYDNRERAQEANRRWHQENPEKHREREKRWRNANPDKWRAIRRRTIYKMTAERFLSLLTSQEGCCANLACRAYLGDGGEKAHIDHDHGCCDGNKSCGRCIRGLLCGDCNPGNGITDDPARLRGKADYLDAYPRMTPWEGSVRSG